MSLPVSLLAQPCTVLANNSTVYTFRPSGVVARIEEDLMPGSLTDWATTEACDQHTPQIRVRHARAESDRTRFLGLPTAAGTYIVPAQFCAELRARHVGYPDILAGVQFLTPEMLIFPGQIGHPGGEVRGPVAPGLILRYSGGRWL